MRTLKKTLCLVLALVMVLGLCAFNVSAAEFTDEAQITYKEAVAVLSGIGVINGMGDGTFAPKGTLTRAQACTIISKLMGGDGITAKSTFTDMEGYGWAESYVAYCQAKGIVGGYGDGTFGPGDTLTGSQWGRMLLLAAGFDAKENGFESGNANWEIGVAKAVKDNGLAKNITGFNGTQSISRDAACEMAFQALEVGVNGKTVYVVEDLPGNLEFDTWLEAYIAANAAEIASTKIKTSSPSDCLKSQNFPTLASSSDVDDAGRPAKVWKLGEKTIATVATPASYTATAKMTNDALNKALKDAKVLKADGTEDYNTTTKLNPTANGKVVEWFSNGTVVVTSTALVTVSGVTSVPATRLKGAHTVYAFSNSESITVFSTVVNEKNDVDTGVVAGAIKQGDKVLYTTSTDGTKTGAPTVTVPETVKGLVTLYNRNTGAYTVAGKTYVISDCAADDFTSIDVDQKNEKEFYLDSFGNLIGLKAGATSVTKYGLVLGAREEYTLNGSALNHNVYAIVAGMDGTVTEYPVSNTKDAVKTGVTKIPAADPTTGLYSFAALDNTGATAVSGYTAKSNTLAANLFVGTNTLFVYADYKDTTPTGTVTLTAIGNSRSFSAGYAIDSNNDKIADVVFVFVKSTESTEGMVMNAYITDAGTFDGTAYTYNAIVEGKETTVVTAKSDLTAGFYGKISADGNTVEKLDIAAATDRAVGNVGGFLTLGPDSEHVSIDADKKVAADVPVYVINATTNMPVTVYTISFDGLTALGGTNGNDAVVLVVKDNVVSAIYVILNDAV